jgi:hypothetical protein
MGRESAVLHVDRMGKADKVRELCAMIARNAPHRMMSWDSRKCPECGEESARRGDVGLACASKRLSELVGSDLSRTYVRAVVAYSVALKNIDDAAAGGP